MAAMADQQEEHTGGMIALIPRTDDAQALTVPRGESAEDMHLTSVYLGDVTTMDNRERNAIAAAVASVAVLLPPVRARVFGHALFNPDHEATDAQPPCAVYLIGDAPDITHLHEELRRFGAAEQHDPYVPHIAAGYGTPFGKLTYTGAVVFDRLRLALGNDHYDFPLGEPVQKGMDMVNHIETKRHRVDEHEQAIRGWAAFEAKVMSPSPNAAKLREYWAHGKGRAKWRPGTPGDFNRLRRHLAKYVHNPRVLDGLTANIHKLATGEWPGPKAHSHKSGAPENMISAEEFKAAMLLADPDAEIGDDLFADEPDGGGDGADADGADDDPDDEDAVYEQALMDEWLYFLNADGELEHGDGPVGDEDLPAEDDDEANETGPRAVDRYPSLFD